MQLKKKNQGANKGSSSLVAKTGSLEMLYKTKLEKITTTIVEKENVVAGISMINVKTGLERQVKTRHVVLATGGYAADTSKTGILAQHRPDLLGLASTNGKFADGSGHICGINIGAGTIDMNHVQVHPTAFVGKNAAPFVIERDGDTLKEKKKRKTLCAELLRGVGGLLLDSTGNRFVSELEKRNVVVDVMKARAMELNSSLSYAIVLNELSAKGAPSHVPHYTKKNLLKKMNTLDELAIYLNVSNTVLDNTFQQYVQNAQEGKDNYGKVDFANWKGFDRKTTAANEFGPFWVGFITPALHYTMGGMRINQFGESLRDDGSIFQGLHVAGEAAGGIHGANRLGGNALTECVVFGRLVGKHIDLNRTDNVRMNDNEKEEDGYTQEDDDVEGEAKEEEEEKVNTLPVISMEEVKKHTIETDLWTVIDNKVYDISEKYFEHPGGLSSLLDVGGIDGTDKFDQVHTRAMTDDLELIGILEK